ncbi:MAG: class I SAM-dependent methyltransferase [Actinomycetes bacterium]
MADDGARIAAVYDASAPAYEQHWGPALLPHARDLLSLLAPVDGPRRILEVATGTGSLLPDLVRAAGAGGSVVALDRSLGMLRRVTAPVPLAQADALALPVRSGSVDVVVAAFVLFLLPDAHRGAVEIGRVLRPGGELVAATWGEQRETRAEELLLEALDEAGAPEPQGVARSDADTDSPTALRTLLESAGLADVRTDARRLDARFTPAAMLEMRTACGNTGWRFAQLDDARQAEVRAQLARRYARLDEDAFTDTSEVLLTYARRPD